MVLQVFSSSDCQSVQSMCTAGIHDWDCKHDWSQRVSSCGHMTHGDDLQFHFPPAECSVVQLNSSRFSHSVRCESQSVSALSQSPQSWWRISRSGVRRAASSRAPNRSSQAESSCDWLRSYLRHSSASSGVISVSLCTTTLVTDMSGCCSLASLMAWARAWPT